MPNYNLDELLLTELLAMDVYHRGRPGGLSEDVSGWSIAIVSDLGLRARGRGWYASGCQLTLVNRRHRGGLQSDPGAA